MIEELENIVESKEANVAHFKQKIMDNVCYQLAWLCEDLYIESFKLDHYKAILKEIIQEGQQAAMEYWIDKFERFISEDYNVSENSTGTMHRVTSTWKFIATMQMLKELKKLNK